MRHVGTNYFRLVISYLSGNTHVLAIDKNFEFPWKLENRTLRAWIGKDFAKTALGYGGEDSHASQSARRMG